MDRVIIGNYIILIGYGIRINGITRSLQDYFINKCSVPTNMLDDIRNGINVATLIMIKNYFK